MLTSTYSRRALRHARDHAAGMRLILVLGALFASVFVVGHLPFIRGTVDGIDSANFILAVDRYDPHSHQPHPPGYPVHVALARVANAAFQPFVPVAGSSHAGVAGALRLLSVVCGGLVLLSLIWIVRELGVSGFRGAMVTALTATCPLFWLTAMRPLSDVPGLFFSMLAQALMLSAYHESDRGLMEPVDREGAARGRFESRLLGAAAVAGVAVGFRIQTALLTVPLLALVTWLLVRRHGTALLIRVALLFVAGLLVWAIPLISSVGGPDEYLRLLTIVAASDVQGVEMLATDPGPRLLALALFRTLVVPWGSHILGWTAVALAVVGAARMLRQWSLTIGFIAAMSVPYFGFHLMFQETASIRYALPLIPIICVLISHSLPARPTGLALAGASALLAFASFLSLKAAAEYGKGESPVASAVAEVKRELEGKQTALPIAFHHSVAQAVRGETWRGRVLASPVSYEWLELAKYWLKGGREPVLFLADPRRTDLKLIDPVSRRLVRAYRWPTAAESLLGGIQPSAVNWHEISSPGWFVMRGWSLTPESQGVAKRDGQAPGTTGIIGHVRRRPSEATMMVGGRNLGGPCDTGASVEVSVDGRPRAAWVTASHTPFLQVLSFAPGELQGDGDYATITVAARDAAGTARLVDVAIEHFDVQSPGSALAGFDRGWYMPELAAPTGVSWRWTQDVAELRIEGFGRDLELVIRGESPLRYFQRPPRVILRAGGYELASFRPDADFAWVIKVPAAALAASEGRVVLESDQWFIPDERTGNGDRRRLALRIYDVEIRPSQGTVARTP